MMVMMKIDDGDDAGIDDDGGGDGDGDDDTDPVYFEMM